MEREILICRNIEEVYGAVENSLRSALKIKGNLLHGEYSYEMPTMKGQVRIKQQVTEVVPKDVVSFVSTRGEDTVKTSYLFQDAGDDVTKVTLKEEANSTSVLRRYNYLLFSLPLLRNGAAKKLDGKLRSLKSMLEGEHK